MKTDEIDKALENGEDVVESLDREARRLGVTRQSVIKVWLAQPRLLGADVMTPVEERDRVGPSSRTLQSHSVTTLC